MINKDFYSDADLIAYDLKTKANLQPTTLIKRRMDSVPVNSLNLP